MRLLHEFRFLEAYKTLIGMKRITVTRIKYVQFHSLLPVLTMRVVLHLLHVLRPTFTTLVFQHYTCGGGMLHHNQTHT